MTKNHEVTYFPSSTTLDFWSLYDWGDNLQTDGAVGRIISRLEGLVTTTPARCHV
jgi:hypothetical protein